MTRLSNSLYLRQRSRLYDEWFSKDGGAFVMLSPAEQWALHDFYACIKKLSDVDALAHRRNITGIQPSLPQRAGKAFKKIGVFLDLPPRVPEPAPVHPDGRRRKIPGSKQAISVRGVVRPEIDPERLAKILLQHVREQHEKTQRDQTA